MVAGLLSCSRLVFVLCSFDRATSIGSEAESIGDALLFARSSARNYFEFLSAVTKSIHP